MKHANFLRLRDSRLPKALKAIEMLGHLGSHNYESSQEERDDILQALTTAASLVRDQLQIEQEEQEPPSGLTMDQGEITLAPGDGLYLITVGPQIGAAITAIEAGDTERAADLLYNLMRA